MHSWESLGGQNNVVDPHTVASVCLLLRNIQDVEILELRVLLRVKEFPTSQKVVVLDV